MSKKEDENIIKKNANYNTNIVKENISDFNTHYMKIFAANNNFMRSIPNCLDGLT